MKWNTKTSESLPRAIVHVCIENLYASIAARENGAIGERAFVTGAEGALVTSTNHLAASLGLQKGMLLHDALEIYPSLEIVPTDYEAGAEASEMMFDAMRQLSHRVEESGLHRGFVDITRPDGTSIATYEAVTRELGSVIRKRTGLEPRLGLSLNRTLAAVAGEAGAAGGVTVLPKRFLPLFLGRTLIADVPGMTTNQSAQLRHFQVRTASDFIARTENWVRQLLGRAGVELWKELQGQQVYQIGQSDVSESGHQSHVHGDQGQKGQSPKARGSMPVFPAWLDLNLALSRWSAGLNV